jgi:TRAP-type mannitol/chloroaromatic compound transport system permease large subunit
MLDYLKREPVRVRLYTLAVLVLGFLTVKGVVTPADAEFYGTVVAVVLAVETTRRKVVPAAVAKPHRLSMWVETSEDVRGDE